MSAAPLGNDGLSAPDSSSGRHDYVVVARRYRPQTFADLVGQEHVGRALSGAINSGRVGHAYLFTGARGVGKTSSARILAKALNCERGPTDTPCNQCDICQAISSGDDVDVLEIDGASNRGIDEMRELRQNVNVRPSRSRFKIYIIDEVHMLTREAFNALLKTLEEPPEHVKFIFCTTEAEKIPITILSRCQRFDFAGIQAPNIVERLAQIVTAEGLTAEREALEVIARRAAGSMRDSQSLLEQLLSFGGRDITLAHVHAMLGTADDEHLRKLVDSLSRRDPAGALAALDLAVSEGVDVGQLLDQLLGYLRDVMVAAVGGGDDLLMHTTSAEQGQVRLVAKSIGLETVLAMMQMVDQTAARLRYSTHARLLVELALVRICQLADLEELPRLISQLRAGEPLEINTSDSDPRPEKNIAPPSQTGTSPMAARAALTAELDEKKKPEADRPSINPLAGTSPASSETDDQQTSNHQSVDTSGGSGTPLEASNVSQLWQRVLELLTDLTAAQASLADGVAISAPNRVAVSFPKKYTSGKTYCERPESLARLEQAWREVTGQPVRVELVINQIDSDPVSPAAGNSRVGYQEQMLEVSQHPLVRRAAELFDARPVRMEPPDARR